MARKVNHRYLIVLVTTLAIGYVLGFFAVKVTEGNVQGEVSRAVQHDAEPWQVIDIDPPSVEIMLEKDSEKGWNLFLETKNFTFNPLAVGGVHEDGEGHAHLYIDGQKVTRLYAPAYYLGEFGEGTYEVRVTLNSNTHRQLAVNGQVVEDIIMFTVDNHDLDRIDE